MAGGVAGCRWDQCIYHNSCYKIFWASTVKRKRAVSYRTCVRCIAFIRPTVASVRHTVAMVLLCPLHFRVRPGSLLTACDDRQA